ncbi:hypothetical protein DV451_001756 [Geotrichum candidum]|uniref:CCA tRNA nucleotidyltransferase, mitochondrial n=1 Tax=Geotrichum candidum TaxID=1173061 RepID=A0A9P5G629_GEOCN|nr:hypothetical protein DV451_001756 [Geotrichum candidum]
MNNNNNNRTSFIDSILASPGFQPGAVRPVVFSEDEQKVKDLIIKYCAYYNAEHADLQEPLVARITGGWVRDKLLGRESHDLDIAINLTSGLEFAEGLNKFIASHASELGIEPKNIHKIEKNPEKSKHLETATTRLYGLDIDFVNLRSEVYAENSRIPIAAFGTPEEDAFRRDATLNALFYNLQAEEVEDLTHQGLTDLEAGILRTPLLPFETFNEDPLRVLRLIRFSSTFGFTIAPECLQAMRDPRIESAFMIKISRERVGVEIFKALSSDRPQLCLALVEATGLYNAVFHLLEAYHPAGVNDFTPPASNLEIALRAANDTITRGPAALVEKVVHNRASPTALHFWLAVALNPWEGVVAQDEKKKPVAAVNKIVREGLKLSTQDATTVAKALALHAEDLGPLGAGPARIADLDRLALGLLVRKAGEHWDLFFLYSLFKDLVSAYTSNNNNNHAAATTDAIFEKYNLLVQKIQDLDLDDAWALKPIINGKELSKLYGSKGGQWMTRALQSLVEEQLRNPALTKDQAMEFMLERKSLFL